VSGKRLDLVGPTAVIDQAAMDEHHRNAATLFEVMKLDPIDSNLPQ